MASTGAHSRVGRRNGDSVIAKPAGFGIGAFEARQLAQAMGGSVEVMSREGEGTRFRVLLPTPRDVSMERAA